MGQPIPPPATKPKTWTTWDIKILQVFPNPGHAYELLVCSKVDMEDNESYPFLQEFDFFGLCEVTQMLRGAGGHIVQEYEPEIEFLPLEFTAGDSLVDQENGWFEPVKIDSLFGHERTPKTELRRKQPQCK
jgi:hypothetical protein